MLWWPFAWSDDPALHQHDNDQYKDNNKPKREQPKPSKKFASCAILGVNGSQELGQSGMCFGGFACIDHAAEFWMSQYGCGLRQIHRLALLRPW